MNFSPDSVNNLLDVRIVTDSNTYDFSTAITPTAITSTAITPTALPPRGGDCSITPPSGILLETNFSLSCSNWESDNTPLSYQFQYRLENGLYNVLYRGVNNNITTSWIPPGNSTDNFTVKVNATVTDDFGISASPVSLKVQVGR